MHRGIVSAKITSMGATLLPSDLNREQVETILEAVTDPVFTTDLRFVITAFNPAAERLTGFPREQAIGRRCAEVFRGTACNGKRCVGRQVFETGRPVADRRITIHDRFDAPQTVRMSGFPLRDQCGALVGQVQTFHALNGHGKSRRGNGAPDGLSILEASERQAIEDVLRRHGWNRTPTCEELGVSRTTLWRKMRKLGIRVQPPQ